MNKGRLEEVFDYKVQRPRGKKESRKMFKEI